MVTMSDVQSSSPGGPIQLAITNGGSRPSDKWGGGGGSSRPWDKGGPGRFFFSALRASVWSKNKGEGRAPRAPPLDPPLMTTTGSVSRLPRVRILGHG